MKHKIFRFQQFMEWEVFRPLFKIITLVKNKIIPEKQEMINKNRFEILEDLRESFRWEDRWEHFPDREYVDETYRRFEILLNKTGEFCDERDRVFYDIVMCIFDECEVGKDQKPEETNS